MLRRYESSRHSVRVGSETHFKVIIISRTFDGAKLLDRHRAVNDCLAQDELANGVHALSKLSFVPVCFRLYSV
jgi:BolA protein